MDSIYSVVGFIVCVILFFILSISILISASMFAYCMVLKLKCKLGNGIYLEMDGVDVFEFGQYARKKYDVESTKFWKIAKIKKKDVTK